MHPSNVIVPFQVSSSPIDAYEIINSLCMVETFKNVSLLILIWGCNGCWKIDIIDMPQLRNYI